MKNIKNCIVPSAVILIFIAIMTTGGILKKPFSSKDDVKYYIERVKKDVTAEKWKDSSFELDKLKRAWKVVGNRVQFSVERDEMVAISRNIAKIRGCIEAKDKNSAIIEISELAENWDDLEE